MVFDTGCPIRTSRKPRRLLSRVHILEVRYLSDMDMEMTDRFDRLSRIGCVCCRIHHGVWSPAAIHHLTGLRYRSMGKKAKDEHTIPLCHEHHQGREGIHTLGSKAWEERFGTQDQLLEYVNSMVGNE